MRYAATITALVENTVDNPAELTLGLAHGVIRHVFVRARPGHAGTAHLQMFYQTRQVFPATPGETFSGDGSEFAFDDRLDIFEVPHELLLRAWNVGATHKHAFDVQISVLEPEFVVPVVTGPLALPPGME